MFEDEKLISKKDMKLLVSVFCTTYNHEFYIEQALDSFLMQKTDFEFEIIIHDDASTDNTKAILINYRNKFPNKIKLILQEENIFNNKDLDCFIDFAFPIMTGEFIAFCEGDDYWIDHLKLQTQVDLMLQNLEYSFSAHNTYENKDDLSIRLFSSKKNKVEYSLEDFLKNNLIHTSSVLFRKSDIPKELFSNEYKQLFYKDWIINLLLLKEKKMIYIPNIMSVRRMHSQSMWGPKDYSYLAQKTIDVFEIVISANWFNLEINEKLKYYNINLLKKNILNNYDPTKEKGILPKLLNMFINKIITILTKLKIK